MARRYRLIVIRYRRRLNAFDARAKEKGSELTIGHFIASPLRWPRLSDRSGLAGKLIVAS